MKIYLLPICLAVFCLVGCVGPVPIPSHNDAWGNNIPASKVRFVQAGKTTRNDVIQNLGTNYVSLWHEKAIAYSWEQPGWSFTWSLFLIGLYSGEAAPLSENLAGFGPESGGKWRAYFIAFDEGGVVLQSELVRLKPGVPLHQQLDSWSLRHKLGRQQNDK